MSDLSSKSQPYDPRSLPQALLVTVLLAGMVGWYWWASGGRAENEIDAHRLVVAECWNALQRKTASGLDPLEQTQACQRMERGFAQMYGTGA